MVWSNKLRVPLLASVLGFTAIAFGKIILFPAPEFPPLRSFQFPETVPLPDWKLVESDSPSSDIKDHAQLQARAQYQYQQAERVLNIEMQYIGYINPSDLGPLDIENLVQDYMNLPLNLEFQQHSSETGVHALLFARPESPTQVPQTLYLSACIPPRGKSTVTLAQFQRNDTLHALKPDHVWAWFLGRVPYRDSRCLWTTLSMAADAGPEAAYATLEQAWLNWYQWWRQHFPDA